MDAGLDYAMNRAYSTLYPDLYANTRMREPYVQGCFGDMQYVQCTCKPYCTYCIHVCTQVLFTTCCAYKHECVCVHVCVHVCVCMCVCVCVCMCGHT